MARHDHIVKRGNKYVLLAKSSGKVLGTHPTRAAAEAQERAVQAHKHGDNMQNQDGLPGVTAGAKEGNGGPADTYVAQTEELEEIPEHEDDDIAPLEGPGAESGEAMAHGDDDEEMLLDDSETEIGGIFPTGATPAVGGSTIGQHGTISDPEPDVSGGEGISVEGEETNDADEEEEEEEEGEHVDDDDVEMAY